MSDAARAPSGTSRAATAARAATEAPPARRRVRPPSDVLERFELRVELGAHVFERPRAVDHSEAVRLRGRAVTVGGADPNEKSLGLDLEAIEIAPRAARAIEALAGDARRHVEQERAIRPAVAVDPE